MYSHMCVKALYTSWVKLKLDEQIFGLKCCQRPSNQMCVKELYTSRGKIEIERRNFWFEMLSEAQATKCAWQKQSLVEGTVGSGNQLIWKFHAWKCWVRWLTKMKMKKYMYSNCKTTIWWVKMRILGRASNKILCQNQCFTGWNVGSGKVKLEHL